MHSLICLLNVGFYLFLFIYVCKTKSFPFAAGPASTHGSAPAAAAASSSSSSVSSPLDAGLFSVSVLIPQPYLPDTLPPHFPPHLSTVAPSLGSRPRPAPKSAQRLLSVFFVCFFCCTNQQSGFYRRGLWPQEEKMIKDFFFKFSDFKLPIQESNSRKKSKISILQLVST